MRNPSTTLFILLILFASLGSAGVSVEYASHADFSQYRSFSWVEGTAAQDPKVEQWLRDAVTREMLAKGLKKVDEGGDLLVRTRVSVHEERRTERDIIGERGIMSDDLTSVSPTGEAVREVGLGIVVVEMLDGYSKLQVWQGVVGADTRPQAGKHSEKRIGKLINKMFKKYPPK